MKRLIVLIVTVGFLIVALPAPAEAGPTCGSNEPELRLYSGTSQSGTMLGALCVSVRPGGTIGIDENMGDGYDTYRSGDNNIAASF